MSVNGVIKCRKEKKEEEAKQKKNLLICFPRPLVAGPPSGRLEEVIQCHALTDGAAAGLSGW